MKPNPAYVPPEINEATEKEEESLLDEQKRFQSLHDSLQALKERYNKTTEQISELFVRVCGDLTCVEAALKGEKVDEWSYLEDLALSKPTDSSEFQWLLKSKGMEQIEKRRKFLLTATAPDEEEPDAQSKMKTPA